MFDSLSDRLDAVFRRLTGRGKLSEADVETGLREVRLALLEADVNYRVARDFIARIRVRAVGAEVMESLTPGQQLVKIVHDELVVLLGTERAPLTYAPAPPTVVVLAGLQGSGKTTTAARLALHRRRDRHRPLLVSPDVRRPAAMEQIEVLARSLSLPSFAPRETLPVEIARRSPEEARRVNADVILLDTAGRLQVETELLQELRSIVDAVPARHLILVLDAMTGQQAVAVTTAFQETVPLTGAVLSKTDGMDQLRQIKKMGPLEGLIGMLPGAGRIKDLAGAMPSDGQLRQMEAIILSMTPLERERPELIDGSRRRRIARGAGTDLASVNRLLKGFNQMQQMMKQMGKGRGKGTRGLPIDPAQLLR